MDSEDREKVQASKKGIPDPIRFTVSGQTAKNGLNPLIHRGSGLFGINYILVLIRSTALSVFSLLPKAVNRKYPSPLAPKPAPGVPTT